MQRHNTSFQHVEIRLPTVKDFYSQNEELFDNAVDAVVKGCVGQYHFDHRTRKFSGTVTSLDGNKMYEVEITVTDELNIKAAFCSCPEQGICYHIGALALNSGYETPIFSYQCPWSSGSEDSDSNDRSPQPLQEVYVKMETLDQIKLEPCDSSDINSCAPSELLNTLKESSETVAEICTSSCIPSPNNEKPDSSDDEQKSNIKLLTTGHICSACDKMYENAQELEMHERETHAVAPLLIPMFQCAICSSRKSSTRDLESHMRHKHASNECNICGAFLLTPESKQRHITTIHEASQNQFHCGKCSKKFTTENALHYHKCEHSEKHKCYACCRMFSTDTELKEHKNQSAHCTYKCSVCQRIFHNSENYNQHIARMHHNLKRAESSQAFSMLELYGKHVNAHRNTFSCSLCEKQFPTNRELRSHRSEKLCERKRTHQCKICNSIFHRFSNLCKHYELVHHLEPVKSLRGVSESEQLIEAETEILSTV